MALTPKQQRFVAEYLVDLNATQAAIRAGYAKRGARTEGARLLANADIAAALAQKQERIARRIDLTAERTLQEVARVAFFDPRRLLRSDGSVKPVDEWDDDTAAAVAGLDISEEFEGSGEDRRQTGWIKKLKIWDKNAALEKAMKHLGLFEKDNAQQRESLVLKVEAAQPVKR